MKTIRSTQITNEIAIINCHISMEIEFSICRIGFVSTENNNNEEKKIENGIIDIGRQPKK